MKQYYLHDGTSQRGPFDLDELKKQRLTKDSSIWYEGLAEWTTAGQVNELKHLFQPPEPPPIDNSPKPPPAFSNTKTENSKTPSSPPEKKNRTNLVISIAVLFLVACLGLVIINNNPNAIPGIKLEINTPKPKITTSRTDGNKSGLFKARITVYTTVLNQGGDGNVLVTFHVYQDGRSFDRTKSVYMQSNESADIDVTFDEVKYLGGDITYNVEAKAQ